MNLSMPDRYRRWFDYEQDSHHLVLASLNAVSENLRDSEHFTKAVDLLAHLVVARRLWLHRLGALELGTTELFPQQCALADIPSYLAETEVAWVAYLSQITDAELNRVFEYNSLDGPRYKNRVEDVLTQLYGHSLYHRGQIALRLRLLGVDPPETDFIFWTREPIN